MAATDPEPEPGDDVRQRTLEHAQKLAVLGRVVPGIVHELNNPLAAITAFSELLRHDPRLPDDLRDDVELVVGEIARVRRLTTSAFDFARSRPPERVRTSVPALIGAVAALVEPSLRDGRVVLETAAGGDLPNVAIDRSRVQHLLVGLTLDAVDGVRTSDGSGRVCIRAAAVRGAVTIAVEPQPSGDAPGAGDPALARREPAAGRPAELPFDLSVGRAIAESHGGSLSTAGGPAGRGTAFVLTLPIADETGASLAGASHTAAQQAPPAAAHPPSPAAPSRAQDGSAPGADGDDRKRVLVLDDEPSIRAFVVRALGSIGLLGVPAGSGAEALRLIEEGRFGALLCDHRMPGLTGPQVIAALEESHPELARRVVLMSGDAFDPELRAFAAARGVPVLAKPFDVRAVGDAVREVLDRS